MQPQRHLLAGLTALGLAVAPGCESMESPGNPLSPVAAAPAPAVTPAATGSSEPTASPWEDQPGWTEPETFEMSSEEMLGAKPPSAEVEPSDAVAEPPAADTEPAAVELAPAPAPPTAVQVAPSAVSSMSGWPLRLVKTLPEANPPRAILGLPDGRELVVSPGSLVADQGIVVISIAADHVELARVEARGDHASISPVTLLAQY